MVSLLKKKQGECLEFYLEVGTDFNRAEEQTDAKQMSNRCKTDVRQTGYGLVPIASSKLSERNDPQQGPLLSHEV